MRDQDFDQLARVVALGISRRDALGHLGRMVVGGLLSLAGIRAAAAAARAQQEEELPVEQEEDGTAPGDEAVADEEPPATEQPPAAQEQAPPDQDVRPPAFDLTGRWLAGNRQQAIVRQSGAEVVAAYPELRACRAGAPTVAVGFPRAGDDVTPIMFEGMLRGGDLTGKLAVCMLVQVTHPHWEMRPMRMTVRPDGKALEGTWLDTDDQWKRVSLDLVEDPCRADAPTTASLDAAQAALANGATDVAASPNGCTRYRRTASGGRVTSETISAGGKTMLTWNHTPTDSTGQHDMDLDGFFEWRSSVKRGPALKDWRVEVNHFSPSTRAQTRQEIYTRPSDRTLHVMWKEHDGQGKLVTVAEFDTAAIQAGRLDDLAAIRARPAAQVKTVPCSIEQRTEVLNKLRECRQKGAQCLRDVGEDATARKLESMGFTRSFNVICAESNDFVASVDVSTARDPARAIDVYVNVGPGGFFDPNRSEANRCGTMFHEALHTVIDAPHNKVLESQHPRFPEVDQVHGCEQMCFNPNANKCHCAACLKTKTCDKRCQKFKDCPQPEELGAYLPCPKHEQWFPKKSLCEGATKGLACFGIQCQDLDPTCQPPPSP